MCALFSINVSVTTGSDGGVQQREVITAESNPNTLGQAGSDGACRRRTDLMNRFSPDRFESFSIGPLWIVYFITLNQFSV